MYLSVKNLKQEKCFIKKSSSTNEGKIGCRFYEEAKVIIILAKILGAMPISQDKFGKPQFKLLSAISIYSLILFCGLSVIAWIILNLHIRVLSTTDNIIFDDQIFFIAAILFEGFHFMPVLAALESKKRAEYFAAWQCFEQKYYKITKKTINYQMKRYQYIFTVLLLLASLFFIYFATSSINEIDKKYNLNTSFTEKSLMATIDFYYMWIIHSYLATWVFLTLGIRKTAQILLKDLEDIRLRSYLFDELYGLWLDLKNLTDDLGYVFSCTGIYYLCYTFMMITGGTYSFLANITTVETENKYEFGVFAVFTAVAFGLIADSAHRTIIQLGNNFKHSLLQILPIERDPTVVRGIKWFIQTIKLNPPVISLSGYVSLDRGFNVSMLGTLVTYIVIVLQFRATSYQPVGQTLISNITNQSESKLFKSD